MKWNAEKDDDGTASFLSTLSSALALVSAGWFTAFGFTLFINSTDFCGVMIQLISSGFAFWDRWIAAIRLKQLLKQ